MWYSASARSKKSATVVLKRTPMCSIANLVFPKKPDTSSKQWLTQSLACHTSSAVSSTAENVAFSYLPILKRTLSAHASATSVSVTRHSPISSPTPPPIPRMAGVRLIMPITVDLTHATNACVSWRQVAMTKSSSAVANTLIGKKLCSQLWHWLLYQIYVPREQGREWQAVLRQ